LEAVIRYLVAFRITDSLANNEPLFGKSPCKAETGEKKYPISKCLELEAAEEAAYLV